MSNSVSWIKFESISSNLQNDFENLSRLFFKHKYVRNPNIMLTKLFNNPGIETDPVIVDGVRIGFQAKYFTGRVGYDQIEKSTDALIRNYSGKIDKVVFFCNKDINPKTVVFQRVIEKLKGINATYDLCCNDSMLDLIKTDNTYSNIKSLYFDVGNIDDDWFVEKLNNSLNELNPRYDKKGVHIGVDEEGYIHSLYRDDFVYEELNRIKESSVKKIRDLYSVNSEIKNAVFNIINKLLIPDRIKLEEVYKRYDAFKSVIKDINEIIENLSTKIESFTTDEKTDRSELSNLYYTRNEYYMLSSIIDDFNMKNNSYTKYLEEKVLIVEGEAGTGKSHLLGCVANKNSNNKYTKTILLLGQKFLFDDTPMNQIAKMLGIKADFDSFLSSLEGKGELEEMDFIIMIDAINECDKYAIWKNYLNDLIQTIESKKHIKLILSIRSTYKVEIFNENIISKIEANKIPCIQTTGFKHNLDEAIPEFFDYYKIPLTASSFFNYELENPLFLKVYCVTYGTVSTETNNLYIMFLEYMNNYEKKIKIHKNIDIDICYSKEIIKKVGQYFYENNTYKISYFKIMNLCEDLIDSRIIIDGFIRAKIFIKFYFNNQLFLHLNYQRFADYAIALYLASKYETDNDFHDYIMGEITKINEDDSSSNNWLGYISALSVLKADYFDKNLKLICNSIKKKNILAEFLNEYVTVYSLRSNKDIKKSSYLNYILPVLNKFDLNRHFDLLIKLSLRHCELSSVFLNEWLNNLTLTEKDFLWTIYINENYEEGCLIYNIINFGFKHNLSRFKKEDLWNYLLLLGNLLSSTNRELRDKASKAITLIFISNCDLIIPCLQIFLNNVDPYIVSRIMGCCYGAVLNIDINTFNKNILIDLANYIYKNVFQSEIVYQDILFRDYSFNTIDALQRKGIEIQFDINDCKPPYKSNDIPDISEKTLIDLYNSQITKSGLRIIKFSMMPELSIEGFCAGYGDFGRYIFDSALKHFTGFNKKKVFKYAFYYLVNDLKYNDKLFSKYDFNIRNGRNIRYWRKERIGKKYEWITMYHILALISDLFPLNNTYCDLKNSKYKGAWYPYVRDYDPSLFIESMSRIYNLEIDLYREVYSDWNFENRKQWCGNNDLINFKKFIFLKDSKGDEWISLYFSKSEKKEEILNKDYESIRMSSTALLIEAKNKKKFIRQVENVNFWGRRFKPAEVNQEYAIFLKEYVNSSAFEDLSNYDDFLEGTISCGKEKVKEVAPAVKILENGNVIIDNEAENEFEGSKFISTEKLSPCYLNYLWEEEYDYSKIESINLYLPSRFIIKTLGLKQKNPGLWYLEDHLVAVDFQLVKNSNVKGLFVKKIIIELLKNKGYELIWIGMGEKNVGGDIDFHKHFRNDISSLIWVGKDEIEERNQSTFEY